MRTYRTPKKVRRSLALTLLFAVGAVAATIALIPTAVAGGKGNPNPGVIPINSDAHGQTYGEWSAAWWQWSLSIPASENPMLDPDGTNAAVGQTGKVFFLAGYWGASGTTTRHVEIAPGQSLFFPIYNYVAVTTPETGDDPTQPGWVAYLRGLAGASCDGVTVLTCTVDGKPLADLFNYRCQDPHTFTVDLPGDNVWAAYGVVAGDHAPSITDGYWVMLNPLTPGNHVIHWTSASPDGVQDITYLVTVKR